MAFDIQIIRLLDVLTVTRVEEAVGVTPRSVVIYGDDFASVESVFLNGFPSPEFVVFRDDRIIAQVPAETLLAPITDIFVLSKQLTLTQRSLVEFTFGTRPEKTSGIFKLMQTFVRLLIRTPGSNVFHRRGGGGLFQKIGSTIGAGANRDRAAADATVAVSLTRQHIINIQTPERNITPSERLLSASVSALDVDPQNGTLTMSIDLVSHSGQRGIATIVR